MGGEQLKGGRVFAADGILRPNTERLFFGVGRTSDGFICCFDLHQRQPDTTWVTTPKIGGGTSGIVIDNQLWNGGQGGVSISAEL